MGFYYGNDLRRRVVAAIDGGMTARSAAVRFSVAPSTAIHWHRRWREAGSVAPERQGQPPGSKLDAHEAFILELVTAERDIALAEIAERLARERGVRTCPATIWYFFSKRSLTHKKDGPCIGAAAPGHPRPPAALVRRPDRPRSRAADLHRRNWRQYQDGAVAGMGGQG